MVSVLSVLMTTLPLIFSTSIIISRLAVSFGKFEPI